ncbi:MAG: zinc ABC transporter substrate-binding protein [Lentisphaeria bacterium]|nr:zinc ABC transporter substrate-binding protein [Lentisphaeria bacterium]
MIKKFLYIFCFLTFMPLYAVIDVACGTAPEKFIIEQIGGDKVNVFCVMPQGKNIHDFAITPDTVRKVSSAQVFFHTDLLFEQQLLKLLNPRKVRTFDLSRYIVKLIDEPVVNHHHRHHAHDVHTWFSYRSLYRMVEEAAKVLSEIDGKNAAFYFKNRTALCQKINNSRHAAELKLRKYNQRVFITHHAAFGYFANEFNLKQLPFEYNGREITPKNLAFVAREAKKYKVKRIFIQGNAPQNVRRAIQNATRAELVIINPDSYDVLAELDKFTAELEASFER